MDACPQALDGLAAPGGLFHCAVQRLQVRVELPLDLRDECETVHLRRLPHAELPPCLNKTNMVLKRTCGSAEPRPRQVSHRVTNNCSATWLTVWTETRSLLLDSSAGRSQTRLPRKMRNGSWSLAGPPPSPRTPLQ